jgi:predicted CxxxxCH...CXXCH cytochrome family protein
MPHRTVLPLAALAVLVASVACGTARDVHEGATSCANCHPAPSTGAHAAHVDGRLYFEGVDCMTCHTTAGFDVLTHPSAGVAVSFAAAPGGLGAFTAATLTCNSVYCHGNFAGGANASPTWTGSISCTSCHANPPVTGRHVLHVTDSLGPKLGCAPCHEGYSPSAVNRALHVNDVKDVAATAGFDGTGCANACHGRETW